MTDDELTPRELARWTAGYLAGWDRSDELAALDGRPEPAYRVSIRDMERAGRRQLWDAMVRAGEYPDPEEIERRLWPSIIERLERQP